MQVNEYIDFYERKKCRLSQEVISDEMFSDDAVGGKTLFSLISSGTEISVSYLDVFDWGYPKKSGYSAVFEVDYIGKNVQGIEKGDILFAMGNHCSYQLHNANNVVKVKGLKDIKEALFIRMCGVPMATLSRMEIKPGENILVTGLGTVGILAMQVYSNLGYYVIGVDTDINRVNFAKKLGFDNVYTEIPFDDKTVKGKIGLCLECSGNEQAVLGCCNMVRPHGEVSLVGVPWKKCTDISAFEVLNKVFYNYVKLYSGWEMDLPVNSDKFIHESMIKNYNLALNMIADGKVKVDDMYSVTSYKNSQQAYDSIYNKNEEKLSIIFDWRKQK